MPPPSNPQDGKRPQMSSLLALQQSPLNNQCGTINNVELHTLEVSISTASFLDESDMIARPARDLQVNIASGSTVQHLKLQPSATSRLLSLPPEIRNWIYRLVLVTHSRVEITLNHRRPPSPSLLQTCQQIRQEARKIYLNENWFTFSQRKGFNFELFISWSSLSEYHRNSQTVFDLSEALDPIDLTKWLRAYYCKECGRPELFTARTKVLHKRNTVFSLFRIVDRLRRKGMDWDGIEEILVDVFKIAVSRETRNA